VKWAFTGEWFSYTPYTQVASDVLHYQNGAAVDDLQEMPRYYHRYHWLTDHYVRIVASNNPLPKQLTLQQFLRTSQVHLPLINLGVDLIGRWLHGQHQSRYIAMIVQSFAVSGMVTVETNYLMCVPYNIVKKLIENVAVKDSEIATRHSGVVLKHVTHQLYDSQDTVQWLI